MVLPCDEAGAGPVVVLLHAGVADRRMWAEHLEPLAAAGHRAVAVDLPGHGRAVPVPGPQAQWLDVLETMDALGVERAALVGCSFGGAVALCVALVAPARVSALVLCSAPAPGLDPSPALEAAWAAEEEALGAGDVDAAVTAVVEAWTLPGAPAALRERVARMQRRAFALHAQAPHPTETEDPAERDPGALARLEVPALVLAGEHDMVDFRLGAEKLAATLPQSRHAVIAGAGHLAPLETPDDFRALVLAFLDGEGAPA